MSATASLLPASRCGEADKALAAASLLAAASASAVAPAAAVRESGTLPRLASRIACCSASLAAEAAERGAGASSSGSPFCLNFTLMTPSLTSQVLTDASFASLLLMQTNRSSTKRT